MKFRSHSIFVARLILAGFALVSFVSAATLTGTLTDGTTGKPAAGDKVVLIKLAQGMEETAHAMTDAHGNFKLELPEDGTPHLVRAFHQGVTYHKMAPPGTTSVALEVYDTAKKIQGISVTADVMRFQAQNGELQGVRLFAVDNQSKPPRTQMSDKNFEFYLPEGAQMDGGMAMTEGGQPLNTAPVPEAVRNRYNFDFPLRPGTTQFQVAFHLPYTGQANIDPKALYAAEHFVVMLPKTMTFTPGPSAAFQPMQDPHQSDAVVQVVTNTQLGQPLSFRISGTGVLADEQAQANGHVDNQSNAQSEQQAGTEGGGSTANGDNRPGGGLGPPIDAPDPMQKYWPYLLGGFAVLLVGGAVYTMKQPRVANARDFASSGLDLTEAPPGAQLPSRSGLLLEALKEELFQLELDHKQGHISQEEYTQAKSALDQTLERALRRETPKKL